MLACARGGFTHTVVFGGFNAEALKDRIQDAQASSLITADGGWRKGAWVDLRAQAEAAVERVRRRSGTWSPCSGGTPGSLRARLARFRRRPRAGPACS